MDVDARNIEQALQQIEEILRSGRCRFVAFDQEMTGVHSQPGEQEQRDDLPFERYQKLRRVATRYNLIQIGLCFFLEQNPAFSPQLILHAPAIDFNSKHGMDWNRWINHGITYVSLEQKELLKEIIFGKKQTPTEENGQAQQQKRSATEILDSFRDLSKKQEVFQLAQKLIEWYNDEKQTQDFSIVQPSYVRHYFHTLIEEQLPLTIKSTDSQTYVMTVKKATAEQKAKFEEEQLIEKIAILDAHCGFLRVVELLHRAALPIVGHNCFLDLLFFYSAFIGHLPEKYNTWKKTISQFFSCFYDTKILFQNLYQYEDSQKYEGIADIKSSTVENIRDYILAQPQYFSPLDIVLPLSFSKYNFLDQNQAQVFHEAGFDAFLTGWNFVRLVHHRRNDPLLNKWTGKLYAYNSTFVLDPTNEDENLNKNEKIVVTIQQESQQSEGQAKAQQQGREQEYKNKKSILQEIRQNVLLKVKDIYNQPFYQITEGAAESAKMEVEGAVAASVQAQKTPKQSLSCVFWRQHSQNYVIVELNEKFAAGRLERFHQDAQLLKSSEVSISTFSQYVQSKKSEE